MADASGAPVSPAVLFRRHVDSGEGGAACRVRVELPAMIWPAGPHRLLEADVDLTDPHAGDRLADAAAAAFAKLPPRGQPWPEIDPEPVRSAFAQRRAVFLAQLVSVEIGRPTCDGRMVYGEIQLLAQWPRRHTLISERTQLADTVAVEDALRRARRIWAEMAGPDREALVDWDLVAEQVETRRAGVIESYRSRGLLDGSAPVGTVVTVRLADVQPEQVRWLWPLWVPRGHLTLVAGDPGVGKSWFVLALATAVSLGAPLPGMDGPVARGTSLLFALEDGTATVVRPRMDLMGAELERVHVYTHVDAGGQPRALVLPDDTPLLQSVIREVGADLVVIDPLVSLQNPAIDANRQVGMRSVLGPLMATAAAEECAIVICHHLNKASSQDPLYRVNASVDLVAAARVGIAIGRDREDGSGARRGVAVFKTNLGEIPGPVGFEIARGRFGWVIDGTGHLTPDRLFAPPDQGKLEEARDEAVLFLRECLADGPVRQRDVSNLARQAGIDDHSLRKARGRLKVVVEQLRDADNRRVTAWQWRLPGQSPSGGDGTGSNPPPD